MRKITLEHLSSAGLPALLIAPSTTEADAPVLLFLHGQGEAGSSPNELPLVLLHQTPPFQAMLGKIPGAFVLAPQAPPSPSEEEWNWRDHVDGLAQFIRERFRQRRVVATGFSRGGLGVLQMASASPDVLHAWAAVDPQPPRDGNEKDAILDSPGIGYGWLRYGEYRDRNAAWRDFAIALEAKLPPENRGNRNFGHGEMALRAYQGDALSDATNENLYDFLGLRF